MSIDDLAVVACLVAVIGMAVYAASRLAVKGVEVLGLYLVARDEGIGLRAARQKHIGVRLVASAQHGVDAGMRLNADRGVVERRIDQRYRPSVGLAEIYGVSSTHMRLGWPSDRLSSALTLVDRRHPMLVDPRRDRMRKGLPTEEYALEQQPRLYIGSSDELHRKDPAVVVH